MSSEETPADIPLPEPTPAEAPAPEPEAPPAPAVTEAPAEPIPEEKPTEEEKPKEEKQEEPKAERKPTPKKTVTKKKEETKKDEPKASPKAETKKKVTTPKEKKEEKPKEEKPKEEKPKEEKPKEEKPKKEVKKEEPKKKPTTPREKTEEKPKEDKPKEEKPKEDKPPELKTYATQDIIAPEHILEKKKSIFQDILPMEEERTARQAANQKLFQEKWNIINDYIKEGYRSYKSLLDYLVRMNDHYRSQADMHLQAQKILFPSLYRQSQEPIKEPTERKDTMYTVIDSIHSFHKEGVVKLAEFTNKCTSDIIDKGIRPAVDEYKAALDEIAAQGREMLREYEKVGKASYLHFDVLDDCVAKCIKANDEGKPCPRDFWCDYSNYIHCIHEESNCRNKVLSALGKLFEKVKEMESKRVETCNKILKEYFELIKNYHSEVSGMYTPLLTPLTQTDSSADVKILTDALGQLKDKKLTEEEKKICNKPPLDTIPPITKSCPMVIKYGVLARQVQPPTPPRQQPLPPVWETVHVVVTQDCHMLAFNGGDSVETEALFIKNGCNAVCDIGLTNAAVGNRDKICKYAFGVTEKAKKFSFIPTINRFLFKVGSQEDYDDWMALFKRLHVTEDNETYVV